MPVIIRNLDDDAAVLVMVDSNIQREELLPSERAFAYKMKLEALKHQGARMDLTSCQVGTKFFIPTWDEVVSEHCHFRYLWASCPQDFPTIYWEVDCRISHK